MPVRESPRLRAFDYSFAGSYFVTVCTRRRRCLLGEVDEDVIQQSATGTVVSRQIENLSKRLPVELDDFVVIPNHVH